MNLYVRFFWLLFKRFLRVKPLGVFEECRTGFRVNPMDLDLNLHMNNGRYLSIMDLGRIDLMIRARVFWKLVMNGYYPVVVSESIRFKKSLAPFDRFYLDTKIDSWDEKDFFMSQKFYCRGSLVAEGYIKGRFRKRGRPGSVGNAEIFGMIGQSAEPIPLTPLAEAQVKLESLLAKNID